MLHPSYGDLINKVNSIVEEGEAPLVQSRYSIVIASAKRARQLIDGRVATITAEEGKKPLSVAVEELNAGTLKLSREGEAPVFEEDLVEEVAETEVEEKETVEFESEEGFSGANAFQSAFAKLFEAVDGLDDADAADFDDDDFEEEE